MLIKEIQAENAWELRRSVMWPDKDIDYVKLSDDSSGYHYGLFEQDKLVSVISLFIEDEKAQFRKFATDIDVQGKGYGTALLHFLLHKAAELPVHSIWCNARADKATFYQKFGMKETSQRFHKEGIDYVIMEKELNGR